MIRHYSTHSRAPICLHWVRWADASTRRNVCSSSSFFACISFDSSLTKQHYYDHLLKFAIANLVQPFFFVCVSPNNLFFFHELIFPRLLAFSTPKMVENRLFPVRLPVIYILIKVKNKCDAHFTPNRSGIWGSFLDFSIQSVGFCRFCRLIRYRMISALFLFFFFVDSHSLSIRSPSFIYT